MKQRVKERTVEQQAQQENACHHYWVIEVANGPTSMGTCKYCGETKEFYNAFPEYNPMRRGGNPLNLPKMTGVKIDKESKS